MILHAKVLKGAWRLPALVYFPRWQMPFCVLHKRTKFACSLYLFQRQPFFAFNGTEELLGTAALLVWEGERGGLFWGYAGISPNFLQSDEGRAWARALDVHAHYLRMVLMSASQKVSYAEDLPNASFPVRPFLSQWRTHRFVRFLFQLLHKFC